VGLRDSASNQAIEDIKKKRKGGRGGECSIRWQGTAPVKGGKDIRDPIKSLEKKWRTTGPGKEKHIW